MEIISHRGIGFGHAENSIPALTQALDLGFSIEIDIRMSKDGVPFVVHDANLDRLFSKGGKVRDYPAKDLASVHYKENSSFSIVQFEEIVQYFKKIKNRDPHNSSKIFVHVQDINEENVLESIAQIISDLEKEDFFRIFAVDEMSIPSIRMIRKIDPQLKVGLYLPQSSERFSEEFFKENDFDFVWADEQRGWFSKEMVQLAHTSSKEIYAISPEILNEKDEQRWKELIEFGFDGICTDLPKELKSIIENMHS